MQLINTLVHFRYVDSSKCKLDRYWYLTYVTLSNSNQPSYHYFISEISHRAMFKLGAKNLSVFCSLVENISAIYSAKLRLKKLDQNWIGGDILSDTN